MAERGYGDYRRDRDRGYSRADRDSSIFSDDNDRWRGRESGSRWSNEYGRDHDRNRGEDRGFMDRAGDEVRSWFGDDEAERRREWDARRGEAREGYGGRDYDRDNGERSGWSDRNRETWGGGDYGYGAGQSDWRGRPYGRDDLGDREENGFSGYAGARGDDGRNNHWDDNYRRWRDQQIEQLDREYDEYCRHRQQKFESDFDSWRRNRESGEDRMSDRTRGSSSATTRTTGSEGAGATTAGGGRSSATKASTGSSNRKTETTGSSGGAASGKGRSRGSS